MLRKIRRAWEHQPHDIRGPSDDWVNRGLVALFDTRNAIEVMAGNRASAISSSLMGSTGGLAADFSGTANQQYAHRAAYALTGAGSILVLCDIDALSNYGALIGKQSATTFNVPYELRLGSAATDSRVNLVRADGSGYTTSVMSGSNLIAAGAKLVTIVLSMDSGERGPGGSIWVNGTKTTYASSTSGTPATDNSASVWIGRRFDGATQLDGRIYHIGLLNRAANDGDAAEFTARPFSLFEPRRIWVPVSAGGGSVSLIVADATHAHTADGLVLTSSTALSVADATHAHAADNITLVVGSVLTVSEASHAHAADSLTLTAASALAVADATHSHAADDITMSVAGATNLTVADALHGHAADALALTSAHALIVADATHSHTVDGLTLTAASVLAIQDALHAHAADNVTLDASGAVNLLLADGLHAHTADGVALTVAAWLTVADALHGHAADNVALTFGGVAVEPLARYTITAAPRLTTITAAARRLEINR